MLDLYPTENGVLSYWTTRDGKTVQGLVSGLRARLYLQPNSNVNIEQIIRRLESLNFDGQHDIIVRLTQKFLALNHPYKSTILELQVPFDKYNFIFKYIINEKLPVTFYNTELAIPQLFYLETGLFPYCKAEISIKDDKLVHYELQDSINTIDYELPPIKALGVSFEYESTLHLSTPYRATFTPMDQNINTIKKKEPFTSQESFTLDRQHSESMFIQMLIQIIDEYDPDVIVTSGGDRELKFIAKRTTQLGLGGLSFNRDKKVFPFHRTAKGPKERGNSFMSYGSQFYSNKSFNSSLILLRFLFFLFSNNSK